MPLIVVRDERKLSDLVGRAYGKDLSEAKRERAATALTRVNPQLSDPKALKRGTVVMVPEVPGVTRTRAKRGEGDPAAEAVREMSDALDGYLPQLREALEQEVARIEDVHALLDDGELREVAGRHPGGEDQLQAIVEATDVRKQALETTAEAIERAGATVEELEALAESLR